LIPLAINGIGPVGAFGTGITDFRTALAGDTKVTPEITRVTTRNGDYDLPVFRADSKLLKNFVKPRKLRRLDNFSRLALLGAILAVADSDMDLIGSKTGLIIASAHGATATTFAFLDSVIDDGDALASPTLFSNSVHNAAASHIAEHFAITGPTLSLTQGADSLTMALITACQWLAGGRVETVLCGVVDCYCDVLGYCWQSYREQCKTAKLNPTTGPGEGTLFLHLTCTQENVPQPRYGYLKKIEPDYEASAANLPFIISHSDCSKLPGSNGETEPKLTPIKNWPQVNLTAICGALPIPASFNLAAAATRLHDKLFQNDASPKIDKNS